MLCEASTHNAGYSVLLLRSLPVAADCRAHCLARAGPQNRRHGRQAKRPTAGPGQLEPGGFPFVGLLDEVSVFRGALKPPAFSFGQDYPSPYGTQAVSYPASGRYQSPPYDWAVPARLADLTIAAELNQGRVTATVETSDDEFQSVRSQVQIAVKDGVDTYPLVSLKGAARGVRVRLELAPGEEAVASPTVDGFRIRAEPAGERPGE